MSASIAAANIAKQHAGDAAVMAAILVDLAALRAAIVGITAKLDADAGVTGTDFASLWNPAALTVVA